MAMFFRCALALLLLAAGSAHAANLVVTPARGAAGATIKISASGLSAATTYTLEFAGTSTTTIGTVTTNAAGTVTATKVLPALTAGGGKMRLRTGGGFPPGGTVVAYTAFTALPSLVFTPLASNVHAGQSTKFRVTGVSPGTVTVYYEDLPVAGPTAVSTTTFIGRFAVPTDRPASFPANARVRVENKVGRVVVNTLETTMPVLPRLASPFTIGITQPPVNSPRAGQRFNVAGSLAVGDNEPRPSDVSLWYFGGDGQVFPLGAAEPTGSGNNLGYTMASNAPGVLAMTAGATAAGAVQLVGNGTDTYGRPRATIQPPANTSFNLLPPDRWRIRVRVRKPNGQPIPGAIVQIEGAPVSEPEPNDNGYQFQRVRSLSDYVARNIGYSQFAVTQATDAQGCPITLSRKIADNNGDVTFEFDDEALAMNVMFVGECNAGGSCDLDAVQRGVRLAIDASAQGYGFQFTSGPDAGDFLPHIYNLLFEGAGDGDLTNDIVHYVDWYQNVEVATGDRDSTYTLNLPPIQPKVALFDVAIKPWVAVAIDSSASSGSQGWGTVRQVFGPVNSLPTNAPYTSWISIPPSEAYPTEITVRTDPAVTGAISSAQLKLDLDRNGSYEYTSNFSSAGAALDCTIDGLDKSLTWRAQLPPTLKNAPQGRVLGYVKFVGQNNSGQALKRIGVDMVKRDLSWMTASRYSQQRLYYRFGGQQLAGEALEDTADAAIQLPSNPGYEIGRLRNETNNQRLVSFGVNMAGNEFTSAPLDGTHKEAGRDGDPTSFEPALGITYGPDTTTLIDESFPLFYYVWGVPLLAGVEVGADFSLLADITTKTRFELTPQLEPRLALLETTPGLDLGLNFYLDLDVLFDLVDGGVDLDAIFALDMPIRVVNGQAQPIDPQFEASLQFSWHFEVFCLPLDFICDAINDIEGCQRLLPDDDLPCLPTSQQRPQVVSGGQPARVRPIARALQTAIAYSRTGAGLMAFTRDESNGTAPPVLVVRPADGGDFGRDPDDVILSTAPGIRSVALEFYSGERAVAVWAENADSYATLAARTPAQRIARQRLMYALWDGENWTAKAQLTPASGGEGGVDLAGCDPVTDTSCPVGGEVLAVWTRDMAGDIKQHRTRVYSSRYQPSRGWTTPQAVDGAALLDSAPSAAYVDGQAVAAFVRSTNGVFADTDARRVAYRFLQTGTTVQVPAALPGGAAWPSIVGTPDGGFAIAHTFASDPRAFVGNRQRIALGYANACASGICTVAAQAVTDASGRPIYGERPTALVDGAGNVSVVMRGTGFGEGTNGVQRTDNDPIGMVAHTGELVSFATARGQPIVTLQPLSVDGAAHYAPSAAIDPELGAIVALSTRSADLPQPFRAKLAAAGVEARPARAAAMEAEPDMVVYSAEQGVDFAVESLTTTATQLTAGATIPVQVRVRNGGGDYESLPAFAAWQVVLSFDAPYEAGGANLASRGIPSLASGQATTFSIPVTVPAGFSADQAHVLYARIYRTNNPIGDVNNTNDEAHLEFGGMPMVFGVTAGSVPGTPFVQLRWEPVSDPLLGGYRVWYHDGDGRWRHLGSSFNPGFLDLSAPVGTERSYRITSYSKNAIESPPSDAAAATATLIVEDAMFGNGFE